MCLNGRDFGSRPFCLARGIAPAQLSKLKPLKFNRHFKFVYLIICF